MTDANCWRCGRHISTGDGYATYSGVIEGTAADGRVFFSAPGPGDTEEGDIETREIDVALCCEECANSLFTGTTWREAKALRVDMTTADVNSAEGRAARNEVIDFSIALHAKGLGFDFRQARFRARELARAGVPVRGHGSSDEQASPFWLTWKELIVVSGLLLISPFLLAVAGGETGETDRILAASKLSGTVFAIYIFSFFTRTRNRDERIANRRRLTEERVRRRSTGIRATVSLPRPVQRPSDVATQQSQAPPDENVISVKCSKCNLEYRLGLDALVVTDDGVGESFTFVAGSYTGGTADSPDLVAPAAPGWTPSADIMKEVARLKRVRTAGTPRHWRCNLCKTVHPYPWFLQRG